MKRIVLMVMLLVAGALALMFLALWIRIFLAFITPFGMLWGASVGSGGIGSVSAGGSESFVESVPMLFPSFLLWRVCANLAAGGDRVMARHRRFHGVVTIVSLLLVAAVIGLVVMALTNPSPEPPLPEAVLMPMFFAAMMLLPPALFGLTVIQLFSVVVTFRTLMRDGQHAS